MRPAGGVSNAIQMDRYGGPDVLQLRRVPVGPLPPTEVRVKVLAAAVNRADLEIRSGRWPIQRPDPFPYTPGLEVLGEVVEVGSQVEGWRPGDRVITMMQRLGGIHGERPGGYRETVELRPETLAAVPTDAEPFSLAALGLGAVTALEGLRRLKVYSGCTVAVLGASGGVGSAAISLAHGAGARVIAVLPRAGKQEYVKQLGADEVVLLDSESLTGRYGPRSLDCVLELLGSDTFADSVAALRPGGRLCLVGAVTGERLSMLAWDLMQDLLVTGFSSENLTGDQLRADVEHLVTELRTGRLSPPRFKVMQLGDAPAAHRLIERGDISGRVLLVP